MDLAARVRADAALARRQAEERPPPPPSSLQRIMAYEVGGILGIEVDPHTVSDRYEDRYYVGRCKAGGLEWTGYFMHDTNGSHRIAVGYTVRRRGRLRAKVRTDVERAADLIGLVPGA